MIALLSSGSLLQSVWNILLAFVILMVMVTIHEAGHYTAGKLLKFKINEFAVGMGPKVFSRQKKDGEVFSLRLLPLGGFCAFEGEDEENDTPGAFNKQAPWKRLIVLFSGAFFNFLSAMLICAILFASYGETVAKVGVVFEYADTPAQALDAEDIICEINGKRVYLIDSLNRYMSDDVLEITVIKSNGSKQTVTAQKGTFTNTYMQSSLDDVVLGVGEYGQVTLSSGSMLYKIDGKLLSNKGDFQRYLADVGDSAEVVVYASDGNFYTVMLSKQTLSAMQISESTYSGLGISPRYTRHKFGFWQAVGRIVPYCLETGLVILRTLGGLFTGDTPISSLGGPVTTISTVSSVVSYGFASVLLLVVLISINLAVFNLLPVPSLDGCRMVFVLIEWIRKKPIDRNIEAIVNGVGLILLITLMIVVDLLKL